MTRKRILVIEDDDGVALLIAHYLEECGYALAARAATGEEALRLAPEARADLALADINLAGTVDGVTTAIQLRERHDLPVVFVTGLVDDNTIRRSQEAKAFGYVVKPFRQEDLRTSIDLALTKHALESRLRRAERSLAAAVRSIGEGVITTDETGRVNYLNPVAEQLTGWNAEDAVERTLSEILRLAPPMTALTGGADPLRDVTGEFMLESRDGRRRPVEYSTAPIRRETGPALGRVVVFRDITERRDAEEKLKQSREELRSLAAHVEATREEERTRIAREVHDQLGQMITGLRMDLAWVERRLGGVAEPALQTALAGKARSMFELLDQMVKSVRRISSDLRPVQLDDLGLTPAMEWQAREWQTRTGIECGLLVAGEPRAVPAPHATALFRIFQEALTNVARHAQASRVQARLDFTRHAVTFEVCDNGRGLRVDESAPAKSLGLVGMRERASLLSGSCSIQGAPGRGTIVRVSLPLPQAAIEPSSQ